MQKRTGYRLNRFLADLTTSELHYQDSYEQTIRKCDFFFVHVSWIYCKLIVETEVGVIALWE